MKNKHSSDIHINVTLDENKIPERNKQFGF